MLETFSRRRVTSWGVDVTVTFVTASERSLLYTVTRSAPREGVTRTLPSTVRSDSGRRSAFGRVNTLPARKPRYRSFSVGARKAQPRLPRTVINEVALQAAEMRGENAESPSSQPSSLVRSRPSPRAPVITVKFEAGRLEACR